ncbi:hypothetical protein PR003_g23466 [Phytophthora rubi]|uniref:Uncharacterized protein n=1 Tax=Phytophthora rubi TaxID=129364 RepID=A0A6A3MUL9_9STRA|nr:hypothetical protein PR002_g8927 [Phytophthora rubi]KAE9037058.1 hypothetical protein PR001_g8542 [Phytophthora rubi]KAE9297571.1 hypothetical protein PR003_g23466 [Phytophthora rubi]
MAPPITIAGLQEQLRASNSMQISIPEYADITGRLYKTLEVAMKVADIQEKSKLQKTKLNAYEKRPPISTI